MKSEQPLAARPIDYLKVWPQYLYPQYLLSNVMYKLTRSKRAWWKNYFIRWFIHQYDVNMSEAIHEKIDEYDCFNDFFTRPLKPDARPFTLSDEKILCPVDGYVSQLGSINGGEIFQAKGQNYTLTELLANQQQWINEFQNGAFATLYLSPKNYHRIHMPYTGTLTHMTYVPGKLFSVNPATARTIPRLFARNERVICHFDTSHGPMILILIGAIFVGSIETTWHGVITPPHGATLKSLAYGSSLSSNDDTHNNSTPHAQSVVLKQAEEMGRFNMGSTVILLFPEKTIEWQPLASGDPIMMGQLLANYR